MKSVTKPGRAASLALTGAAASWLTVALAGQWAFFAYIIVFYGPTALSGDFEDWGRNVLLTNAYVAGDTAGNIAFLAHALLASVIAFGGALQLLPWVRGRFPTFHRWNGRVFLLTAAGLSLTGFYLIWVRGSSSDLTGRIAITTNGVLILAFAALALRTAMKRDFVAHRRWAMRLYLVSNAQWFVRIGTMGWIAANGGPRGVQEFTDVWRFGCYLVPLAVLEVYLRTRDRGGAGQTWAVAAGLFALTLLTLLGVVVFGVLMLKIIHGDLS